MSRQEPGAAGVFPAGHTGLRRMRLQDPPLKSCSWVRSLLAVWRLPVPPLLRSSCGRGRVWKRPFTWGDRGPTATPALGAAACQEETGLGRTAPPALGVLAGEGVSVLDLPSEAWHLSLQQAGPGAAAWPTASRFLPWRSSAWPGCWGRVPVCARSPVGEAGPLGRAGGAQDPSPSCNQASGSRNPGSRAQDLPGRWVSRTDLEVGASGAAESGGVCVFCRGEVPERTFIGSVGSCLTVCCSVEPGLPPIATLTLWAPPACLF